MGSAALQPGRHTASRAGRPVRSQRRELVDRGPVGAHRRRSCKGLDWVARLLKATGRVPPMSTRLWRSRQSWKCRRVRLRCTGAGGGRHDDGRIVDVALTSIAPRLLSRLRRSMTADWVVLGPGSWFTSVIPHLLVPEWRRS